MEERSNDTSYMDITDIIGKKYKPIYPISPDVGMRIMDDLTIGDEMDTIITGSFGDWTRFISFIIDKYLMYKEPEMETGDFDLTQLGKLETPEKGIVSDFLENYVHGLPEKGEIPKMVNLQGELPHHDRFFEILKEYEKHKLNRGRQN